MDFYAECLKKIENNVKLTETELCKLVEKCSVSDEYIEDKRYDISVKSVVEICGRYFSIIWGESRKKHQPNEFFEQPIEVEKRAYKEILTISTTEWIPIKNKRNKVTSMNVELINADEARNIWETWSKVSSVCYDSTIKNPDAIGKYCFNSGHFSGSRGCYFIFKITDCPRFVIDQLVRHEVGVFKNVQSFRYVDKDNFDYQIPSEIEDNTELLDRYNKHMAETAQLYDDICQYVKTKGSSSERGNEQARYVLPMSTLSSVCIGFTIEALIHYTGLRLCNRTEDVHRCLAYMIKAAVAREIPDVAEYLVPQCDRLLYCPESKCCGRHPTKSEVVRILQSNKV